MGWILEQASLPAVVGTPTPLHGGLGVAFVPIGAVSLSADGPTKVKPLGDADLGAKRSFQPGRP